MSWGSSYSGGSALAIKKSTFKQWRTAFITSQGVAAGTFYTHGFYSAPAADSNLTQLALTQIYGTAGASYAAHAFFVFGAATGAGGSGADRKIVITVTGVSVTDAGVRNGADSEVITADAESLSANAYIETTKKWLGQITYTLSVTGADPYTTYSCDFNFGLCRYEQFGGKDITLTDIDIRGHAGAAETGLEIELLKHSTTGWTYSAAAFVPGAAALVKLSTDHSTDNDTVAGQPFSYKRSGLSTTVSCSGTQGVLVRFTTAVANSIQYAVADIGATFL